MSKGSAMAQSMTPQIPVAAAPLPELSSLSVFSALRLYMKCPHTRSFFKEVTRSTVFEGFVR